MRGVIRPIDLGAGQSGQLRPPGAAGGADQRQRRGQRRRPPAVHSLPPAAGAAALLRTKDECACLADHIALDARSAGRRRQPTSPGLRNW